MTKDFFDIFGATLPVVIVDDVGFTYPGFIVTHVIESWSVARMPIGANFPVHLQGQPCGIVRTNSGGVFRTLELPPENLIGKFTEPLVSAKKQRAKKEKA